MNLRLTARAAALVLALGTLGCTDDNYEITDLSGKLEVTPAFYGIDEGFPPVQFEASIDGEAVQVTWESSNADVAVVSNTGLVTPVADGFAAITATLVSDPRRKKSASFTVNELFGTPLVSGAAIAGIGGVVGQDPPLLYRIYVPEGTTSLDVSLRNGTGDLDILVRRGPGIPSWDEYDCASYNGGNDEDCSIADPTPGTWYILVDVYAAGGGATLTVTVNQ